MKRGVCHACGAVFPVQYAGQRHCVEHEPRGRANRSPTTRAQDATYPRNRKVVLVGNPSCIYCGGVADAVDHVLAVANGGRNELSNLAPCCGRCNYRKRDAL